MNDCCCMAEEDSVLRKSQHAEHAKSNQTQLYLIFPTQPNILLASTENCGYFSAKYFFFCIEVIHLFLWMSLISPAVCCFQLK